MKKISYFLLAPLLFLFVTTLYAAGQPPVEMLKTTANQMLSALKNSGGKSSTVRKIVRQILLPRVDVPSMSRAVVGREYWTSASAAQRKEFENQFVKLVIKTYATPLSNYTNEKIKFYPIRGYDPSSNRTQVMSNIVRDNGPPIPVSYRLVKYGNDWKVYDFSVEGVSMVQSYRSQFESTLRQNGFEGLLKQLRKYNQGNQ